MAVGKNKAWKKKRKRGSNIVFLVLLRLIILQSGYGNPREYQFLLNTKEKKHFEKM